MIRPREEMQTEKPRYHDHANCSKDAQYIRGIFFKYMG
jgi:hypothetical protein